MAERAGLENRCPGNWTVGSNPTPSAISRLRETGGSISAQVIEPPDRYLQSLGSSLLQPRFA